MQTIDKLLGSGNNYNDWSISSKSNNFIIIIIKIIIIIIVIIHFCPPKFDLKSKRKPKTN